MRPKAAFIAVAVLAAFFLTPVFAGTGTYWTLDGVQYTSGSAFVQAYVQRNYPAGWTGTVDYFYGPVNGKMGISATYEGPVQTFHENHLGAGTTDCPDGTGDGLLCDQTPPSACTAGDLIQQFGIGEIAPSMICAGGCQATINEYAITNNDGVNSYWWGEYVKNGTECDGSEPNGSDTPVDGTPEQPPAPDGCNYVGEVLVCGNENDDMPGGDGNEQCVSINGITTCLDPDSDPGCGFVNGELWCPDMPTNCGTFNGEFVCVQPPPGDVIGPQNSAPDGCIVGSNGSIICLNQTPVDLTDTQVEQNPDGSTTTTTTSTDSSSGTTTITITNTQIDGSSTSTTTTTQSGVGEQGDSVTMPTVEPPNNDQYSSMLDGIYDDLITAMGQDDPGEPGFSNPLQLPASSGCTQMTLGIGGYQTTFPGPDGCNRLSNLRIILEWALYIITALSIIHIALKKPS